MQIKIKNMWLRYLACAGVVVGLLFLIATSCDNTVTEPAVDLEDFSDDPVVNLDDFSDNFSQDPTNVVDEEVDEPLSCTNGFTIELADERYASAFTIGEFTKDETTGSFDAEVSVNLSGLTHENGFVSNHVWLHPDKVNPKAFEDNGLYVEKPSYWEWFPLASANQEGDRKYCKGSLDAAGSSSATSRNNRLYGLAYEGVRPTGASSGSKVLCGDFDVGGVIFNGDGDVSGMKVYEDDGTGNSYYETRLVTVETDIDTTGVYYLRDNISTVTTYDGPDTADGDDLNGKMYWANDSDELYKEYVDVFQGGGNNVAILQVVFLDAINQGLNEIFEGPVKNVDVATGESLKSFPVGGDLGNPYDGGWQKLFTIKPCEKMTNGLTTSYFLENKDLSDDWNTAPSLSYIDSTNIDDAAKKVILRQGAATGENDKAIIFDSVPNAKFHQSGTGFFAVQHITPTQLGYVKNAVVTKGMLVCRSAIELETVETVGNFMGGATTMEQLKTMEEKVTGYFDGEIAEDNKGIGMTCYLGLTALWPEAVDGATDLVAIHDAQFAGTKEESQKYDLSDKHIGIVALNIDPEITINDPLLQPIFSDRLGSDVDGTKKTLSSTQGQAALEAIKQARLGSDDKVDFVHGVMTFKFNK